MHRRTNGPFFFLGGKLTIFSFFVLLQQGSSVNDYTCVCPLGYHGRHCELRAQRCADAPCKNGATCYDDPSGAAGYQCRCTEGYQGVNCDVRVDHCRAAPCQNGGTCRATGQDSYQCRCPRGFSGANCEINVDECAGSPCQNGGTCFDFVDDYKCYCHAGFVGRDCQVNVDDCATNPCANGGTCHDGVNDFVCTCPPGFTGKDCSREVNECARKPCLHGGVCIDRLGDFECKCPRGYSGKHCHILPDGTVLELKGLIDLQDQDEDDDGSNWFVILSASILVPALVCVAALFLLCSKRRRRREQRRSDAEAKRENELNAISCANKTKMLDDHMIVNALDFPRQKHTNNPNIADEEFHFSGKDSSYGGSVVGGGSTVGGGTVVSHSPSCSKQLNVSSSALLCDKLDNSSTALMAAAPVHQRTSPSSAVLVDKPRLSNLPSAARRGLAFPGDHHSGAASVASGCSGDSSVCSR